MYIYMWRYQQGCCACVLVALLLITICVSSSSSNIRTSEKSRLLICYRAVTITEPQWKDIGPGPKQPSFSVRCGGLNGLLKGTIGNLLVVGQTATASFSVRL